MCPPRHRTWYYWTGANNLLHKLQIFYYTKQYDEYIRHHVVSCLEEMISYMENGLPLNKIPVFQQDTNTSASLSRVLQCTAWGWDEQFFDRLGQDIMTLMESLVQRFSSPDEIPTITWREKELLFRFLKKAIEVERELDPNAEELIRKTNAAVFDSAIKLGVPAFG